MASRSWGVGKIKWTPGGTEARVDCPTYHHEVFSPRSAVPLRRVAVIRSAVDEEEGRLKRVVEEFDVDASTTLAQLKENIGAQLGDARNGRMEKHDAVSTEGALKRRGHLLRLAGEGARRAHHDGDLGAEGAEGLRRAVLLDADQPLEGDVDLGEVLVQPVRLAAREPLER